MVAGWSLFTAETRTGKIMEELQPTNFPSWNVSLNEAGSISANLHVDTLGQPQILRNAIQGYRFSLVLVYDGIVVQAGPITGHSYNDQDCTVSVTATGIRDLFAQRFIFPLGYNGTFPSNLTLTNKTYKGLIHGLIEPSLDRFGGELPLVLVPGGTTGEITREYIGHDLRSLDEEIRSICEEDGGPDIDFQPRFKPGSGMLEIEWLVRIGDPIPGSVPNTHIFEYGSTLTSLNVDHEPAYRTRVYTKGTKEDAGAEDPPLIGTIQDHTLIHQGWPFLESADMSNLSDTTQEILDSKAKSLLETQQRPQETWDATARVDGRDKYGNPTDAPRLGLFNVGDLVIVNTQQHRWVQADEFSTRILGISGSNEAEMTISFESTEAMF